MRFRKWTRTDFLILAKEYGYHVYACDLWSNPNENQTFFYQEGMKENQLKAVKADANHLPFKKEFFDAIVCVDSYNYFGRDPQFLDEKLLPYLKKDGFIYIAIPGMKKMYIIIYLKNYCFLGTKSN